MDNHIILVLFNIRLNNKIDFYKGSPSWMEQRMELFKKYTLNSFNNQTDKNFWMFIVCDPQTPSKFKDELLNLEKDHSFLVIIWSNESDDKLNPEIIENYIKVRGNKEDEVLVSRFYNDDIAEARYNEFVKLSHKDYDIISISRGLYWDLNKNIFKDSNFPTGPFVSLKSTITNLKNPHQHNHHDYINKLGGVSVSTKEPLWIQLIHGKNLWNTLDKMPGVLIPSPPNEFLKKHFGCEV